MMKHFRYSLIIIFLLMVFIFWGQTNELNKNLFSKNNKLSLFNNSNTFHPIRYINNNFDEFGEPGFNAFIGSSGTNSGYLAVPDYDGYYNLIHNGTIELWIMPTDTLNPEQVIVAKGDSISPCFSFYWTTQSNNLGFKIGNVSSLNSPGQSFHLNEWTHIAVTWTGQPGNYLISFFINGALSGLPVSNTGIFNTSTDSLTIGGQQSISYSKNLLGYLDEVKIWNTARTQTQIAQNRFISLGDYSSSNTDKAITSASNYTGLISSWTFNLNSRDDIGGKTGYIRGNADYYFFPYTAGYPIPYNFALYCAGYGNSYVTIPYTNSFNLNQSGTVEAWVYPLTQITSHIISSIGNTGFEFFWGIRKALGNKQILTIGGTQFSNSDGTIIPANKWTHIAATWVLNGGGYTVTFYVNGIQSGKQISNSTIWTATSGTLRIGGWHRGAGNSFSGYVDELKFWSTNRTDYQIKNNIFASCRSVAADSSMVAAWNFDGNLRNFSSITGIDGSFNTGGNNNCYLSAYLNETTSGAVPNNQFIAFPTVLTSDGFPNGYINKILNIDFPISTTINDTIKIKNIPGNLTDIQVFISIQHPKISDLKINLKSPNNSEILLSDAQGGTSENGYLTIFDDSLGNLITSSIFLSPWTNCVKPQNPMGTFGNTSLNGNWVISIANNFPDFPETFLGWGIRFNNLNNYDSVKNANYVPDYYVLYQNYPNPYNATTKIKFDIPIPGYVRLRIFDILGRVVSSLINENMPAGTFTIEFSGNNMSSGVYFYKIETTGFSDVKKMVLIK